MTTYTAALKVNYQTSQAEIFFNGNKIGECSVFTRFNHCFENDYFYSAYPFINKAFEQLTGMSVSMAGTLELYKLEYTFI